MQKKTYELSKDIFWVGVNDKDLRIFDITMETIYGTTYNSYLIKGSEKSALIDTAKANFSEEYIQKVEQIMEISNIDYLVLNHTEPDHSGSVAQILDKNPDITIIASAAGLSNLKEIINRPFQSIRATENLVISLGNKNLTFYILPNLHWPDTIFTYLAEDEILFTCDFFGAHYSFDGVLSKNVRNQKEYLDSLKYYFDCIMSPFKPFVLKALEKIKDINIKYVATSHGPIIDETNLVETKKKYFEWASPNIKKKNPLIVIPFASAYGYTKKMAYSAQKGIEDAFSKNVDCELYDLVETSLEVVLRRIEVSEGFLIGSTTILRDSVKPVWDVLSSLNPEIHGGKFASAFGSYGWSGEAVQNITERLLQLKMKIIPGLRVRFNPSDNQLKDSYDYGYKFGLFVQGKLEK